MFNYKKLFKFSISTSYKFYNDVILELYILDMADNIASTLCLLLPPGK